MDQNSRDKTLENLTRAENILIVISRQSGFGGLAGGLALCLSISKLGKNVSIAAGAPTAGDAQRIYGADKIGKLANTKNPVIVISDAVQTVDKVSYFLDQDQLKVVIHPLPGSKGITREQISLEYSSAQPNLIFAIGFRDRESLEKEITHEHKITSESWLVNISKDNPNQKFAQIDYVNPGYSGVGEVAARFIQEMALPMDEDVAYNLYAALADSTDNFAPAKTGAQTFEIATWLVKFGAGRASMAQARGAQSPETRTLPNQPQPRPTYSGFSDFIPSEKTPAFMPGMRAKSSEEKRTPDLSPGESIPPIEDVESLPISSRKSQEWLKPPKIYKGAKSIDGENKR